MKISEYLIENNLIKINDHYECESCKKHIHSFSDNRSHMAKYRYSNERYDKLYNNDDIKKHCNTRYHIYCNNKQNDINI